MPSQRNTILAAVGGAIVGALVVGVLWIALKHDNSTGASTPSPTSVGAVSTASVSMPSTLGTLVKYADASKPRADTKAHWTKADQVTAAAVSAAYGGAPAGVTSYTAEDLSSSATAVVVRAPSPALWVVIQDATWLGLALPFREVRTVGDAQCSIQNDPTVAGKQPTPDSVHVLVCQRTSPTLTVQVLPYSTGGQDPNAVVAMVDSLFQSVSGG